MKKIGIVLAQLSPALLVKEENLKKIENVVENHDADLYVFGELFITGYMCRDHFRILAEPIMGETVNKVSRIAKEHDASIVFGMPELDEDGETMYNSCIVATPDEKIQRYRKINLADFGPFEEKLYFKPGHELEVFETPVGKIGCFICYDLFFPEICKAYCLDGAELLVGISAGPTTSREFFEKVLPARALENTTFLLFCNLVGTELSLTFYGGSTIISPMGKELVRGEYLKEDLVNAEVDLTDLEGARRLRPTLNDTRFDILEKFKGSKSHRRLE